MAIRPECKTSEHRPRSASGSWGKSSFSGFEGRHVCAEKSFFQLVTGVNTIRAFGCFPVVTNMNMRGEDLLK
jgi:hypothetical protein